MIELKTAGLYIANGKKTSILIRVTGEYPMLNIVSGVLLNDMQRNGTITKLDSSSLEIQDILSNPKSYVFDYPAVGDAINNEEGLEASTSKQIEYSENVFSNWVEIYDTYRKMHPHECDIKMLAVIIKEGYGKRQADLILKQIKTRMKTRGIIIA